MKKSKKRVLFVTDMHCGHRVGLTPPKFQSAIPGEKYHRLQVELYDAYRTRVRKLKKQKKIDICVVVGDSLDGKGVRSGGTELIAVDMRTQVNIAKECLEEINAETYVGVHGTAYHVAPAGEDWESVLADEMNFQSIQSHLWLDVNGLIFDVKHFVGATSVPYGRNTQLEKDQVANLLWNEVSEQPRGDVFIRGHLHHFHGCFEDRFLAIVLPALQGAATKFGARKCSLPVNFGLVWFDVYSDGSYSWNKDIIRVESQQAKVIKL